MAEQCLNSNKTHKCLCDLCEGKGRCLERQEFETKDWSKPIKITIGMLPRTDPTEEVTWLIGKPEDFPEEPDYEEEDADATIDADKLQD